MSDARPEAVGDHPKSTEVNRRTFLGAAVVAAAAPVVSQLEHGPGERGGTTLPVVSGGQAVADVVVPPDADEQTLHAVDVLVSYVERASGAVLPIVVNEDDDGRTKLYVGRLPTGSDLPQSTLDELADDGFVIHQQDKTITVIGPSSWGTRYGAYEFLERFVDVRWLVPDAWPGFPDLVGTDVPTNSDVAVSSVDTEAEEPAFIERVIHPFPIPRLGGEAWDYPGPGNQPTTAPMQASWGRPSRVRHQIEFQHNLWSLVPPDKYGDPNKPETYHPELFPIIDGETFIPPANQRSGWQPRFSAQGIAEVVAAEVIVQADAAGVTSVSLGVNDGGGYSQDDLDTEVSNHFGFASATAAYYAFVRSVADLVAAERPDLTLGLLAYREVADPPDQPLPDNVVPFLTRDTSSWLDPVNWARDDRWVQAWRQAAAQLGWWDYVYGRPHSVPRLYLGHMAKVYRYLRDNDVTCIMAETRVPLADGPKMWVFSKLLWDPDQNVHRMLIDWCRRYGGPRAAPYLIAYFRHWDEFWTERVPGSEWFESPQRIWMAFRSATYLELVTTDEIAQSRNWLEKALERANTHDERVRMEALLAHFEYHEASVLSFPRRTTSPGDATEAIALLAGAADTLDASVDHAASRVAMERELYDGMGNSSPERYNQVWSGWNLYPLWDVARYIKDQEPAGGPVRDSVEELTSSKSSRVTRYALMTLDVADGMTTSAGANMSFEDATLDPWIVPGGSGITPSTEHAADGAQSMFVPGGFFGRISQEVSAVPGLLRFSIKVHAPAGLEDTAEDPAPRPPYGYYAALRVRVHNGDGVLIQQLERFFSIKKAAGTWYEMTLTDVVAAGAHTADCWIILENDPPVWVDDVSIVQLPVPLDWQLLFTDAFTNDTVGELPDGWQTSIPGSAIVMPAGEHGNTLTLQGVQRGTPGFDVSRAIDGIAGGDHVRMSVLVRRDQSRTGLFFGLHDADGLALARAFLSNINGDIRYRDGNRFVSSGIEYQLDTWYLIQAILHPASGTYEFLVDGTTVDTAQLENTGGPPTEFRVHINGGLGDGELIGALDDLTLSTAAEPLS